MKKIILMLLSYLIIMSPIKVLAESNVYVETKVIGEVKKGSNIEILVDVKNVDNLYATSIDFIYDTNQLTVESIKPTEYITKNIDNIIELGGEVDKNGNTATYSFTFLGDVDGLNGSGTLVKINAKVLSNDKLSITKDNMKVKLVQKADGTVKNYDYKFIGCNVGNDSSGDSSNGSGSSNNTGGNNTSDNDEISGNNSSTSNNTTGNGDFTGNSSSSGSNSSSNEENEDSQNSYNKKENTDKKNNGFSNISNKENINNGDNTSDNKDEEESKEESSSNSENDKENIDKTSNINDSNSEISKNNFTNGVYVLISIGVIGVVGYYYYRFRKNKNKDN
ncbi:MAG: hypothetical protein KIC47_13875 [Clostridium sp.]|nr:hypothetical protein [Clostridium sp.]